MNDHAAKRLGAGIAAGPAVAVRRRRPVSASSVAGRSATLRRSAAVMLTRAPPVLAHARASLPPGYCRIVMLVASSPLTRDRLQAERVLHDRYACRSVGLSAPFGRSGPAGPRPTKVAGDDPREGVPSGGRSGSEPSRRAWRSNRSPAFRQSGLVRGIAPATTSRCRAVRSPGSAPSQQGLAIAPHAPRRSVYGFAPHAASAVRRPIRGS
jgi:hypothetical protein